MLFRRFCWVCAVLVSLLGVPGCGKNEGAKPEAAAGGAKPGAETKAAEKLRPAVVLTPELEGAALCVQVVPASGVTREHVGAMLRAVDLGMRGECTRRFAAVVLPDFDEGMLRAPGCQLRVLRRKFDAQGEPRVALMRGTLVHFEPGSHLAVVRFPENFACRLDAGLAVAQGQGAASAGGAALLGAVRVQQGRPLATGQQRQVSTGLPESVYKMLLGTLEVTLAAPVARPGGQVVALGPDGRPGSWLPGVASVPVLSAEGALAGFALRKGDAWELLPGVALPAAGALPVEGPRFVPLGAAVGHPDKLGLTTVMVKGELYDPERAFEKCQVLLKPIQGREVPAAGDVQADQPALEGAEPPTAGALAADGTLLFALRPPPAGTREEALLVQVVLARPEGEAVFHSAPFLLVANWMSRTAFFQVQGLNTLLGAGTLPAPASLVAKGAAPAGNVPAGNVPAGNVPAGGNAKAAGGAAPAAGNAAAAGGAVPAGNAPAADPAGMPKAGMDPAAAVVAAAAGEGVELSTESPILYGVPVREGREVLLRLEGAPFWKRLSVAEGKWLPLPVPAAELQQCRLAGNKEAIFVLHTGLQELRRYAGVELQLEKKVALPAGMACRDVAAGCLSAEGPVVVVADQGGLAYGPRDLAPGEYAAVRGVDEVQQSGEPYFHPASGDGLAVWSVNWSARHQETQVLFQYADALRGFTYGSMEAGKLPGAGRAWRWSDFDRGMLAPGKWLSAFDDDRLPPGGVKPYAPRSGSTWGPLTSCAHLVELSRKEGGGDPRSGPPGVGGLGRAAQNVTTCTFLAYGGTEPWARAEVPELEALPSEARKQIALRVWLDVRALKFAVWHGPQGLRVHTLKPEHLLPVQAPVLAAYPDCFVAPGGEFRFKPELIPAAAGAAAGTAAPVVTLVDAPEGMTVGADGTLSWKAPAVNVLPHADFGLKVEVEGMPRACEMPLRLELGGLPQVAALSLSLPQAKPKQGTDVRYVDLPGSRAAELKEVALAAALKSRKAAALGSRYYASETPILEVMPGVDDYLCLRLADKTLALFSVKEWRVAGSLRLEDSMTAFPAGDTVLVHDRVQRTVTRYSLPDFKPVLRYVLPPSAELRGLAAGTAAAGPVTLVLDAAGAAAAGMAQGPRTALEILDKQSMTPGPKWAAYAPDAPERDPLRAEASALSREEHPQRLPSSPDGRLVKLSKSVMVVTPAFTTAYGEVTMQTQGAKRPVMDGVFSVGDLRMRRGLAGANDQIPHGSSCGSYLTGAGGYDGDLRVHLYAADDGRPLLDLDCVGACVFNDGGYSKESLKDRVTPLGDRNLVAVLSRNGRLLQVTHVDLGAVLRAVDPGAAYVTSHPFPVVLEGRTMEYRLVLSDPTAASGYELVTKIPGAAVNSLGVFSYRAPDKLDRPLLVQAEVKIRLKNGGTALHRFPLYVVPTPPALIGKKGR